MLIIYCRECDELQDGLNPYCGHCGAAIPQEPIRGVCVAGHQAESFGKLAPYCTICGEAVSALISSSCPA